MLARAKQASKSAAGARGKEYADLLPVDAQGAVAPGGEFFFPIFF